MNSDIRIAVIGAGSWGTTLSVLLREKGYAVRLWAVNHNLKQAIEDHRENIDFLPGIKLPDGLEVTDDLEYALSRVDVVVITVPSKYLRGVLKDLKKYVPRESLVLSGVKGIDTLNLSTMSELIAEFLKPRVKNEISVISGPNLAYEVSRKIPTCTVVASRDPRVAAKLQKIFFAGHFRVYTSTDVKGVELGGALKNIVAIGAGISDGLGFGSNTKSTLIARGLIEMTRLSTRQNARKETLFGLSGLGDLVATCMSRHSRNRALGERIGKGERLNEILADMKMVAEGVETTRAVYTLAKKLKIPMPITEEIYNVLFLGKDCLEAVTSLMTRAPKEEFV